MVKEKSIQIPKSYRIGFRLKLKISLKVLIIHMNKYLQKHLNKESFVILSVIGFAALSLILFKFVGTEFFPDTDESQFSVSVRLPVGTRIEETQKFVHRCRKFNKSNVPEIVTIIFGYWSA